MKEEDRKDEVTKVNEEERSSEEEVIRGRRVRTEKVIRKRMEKGESGSDAELIRRMETEERQR